MKTIFKIIFLLFINFSFGQTFKIESSSIFDKSNANEIYNIAFADSYGLYTYSYLDNVFLDNQKEITISNYDQKLTQINTIRFNLPKLELRAADLDKVIELEDKLIFVSNSMSKKKGIRNIYAQIFDKETNSVSNAKIIASYAIESYSKSGQIEVSYSENKNQFVVLANMPFVKKTKEKIKTWVFDTTLNEVWSATNTLSLDSQRAHDQDVHITNNSEVYLIKRFKYGTKKATSNLAIIGANGIKETVLSQPEFFIRNTTLVNIGTEELISGFFVDAKLPRVDYNSEEGNETSGVFLYSVSQEKILGKHNFEFDNSKNLKSLKPLYTNVLGDDIFMVAEKQTYTSKFRGQTTDLDYFYHYGPSVVINLDTKGTLKSANYLDNSTNLKNDTNERGSISTMPLNGGLKLFYNKNDFRVSSFFDSGKTSHTGIDTKAENNESRYTSYLSPNSFEAVKDYNLAYFVSTNGKQFWINKMTW